MGSLDQFKFSSYWEICDSLQRDGSKKHLQREETSIVSIISHIFCLLFIPHPPNMALSCSQGIVPLNLWLVTVIKIEPQTLRHTVINQ